MTDRSISVEPRNCWSSARKISADEPATRYRAAPRLRRPSPDPLRFAETATMLSTRQSLESGLPELSYGSVWLVGAADGDPSHLSPLAVHALATADAVIHDPAIAEEILDLVQPPRYPEAALPEQAIKRVIKLAEDGWRVVQLVKGNALERAVEGAMRCAERDIPFRIVPGAGDPVGNDASLYLLLGRKTLPVGGADAQTTLVLLIATPASDAAAENGSRRRPLDFSMSGLAG